MRGATSSSVAVLSALLLPLLATTAKKTVAANRALGGEKPSLHPEDGSHRQNLCTRTVNGTHAKSLKGLRLHALLQEGPYFWLDKDTDGIPKWNPGFLAQVLDDLAQRGGFTWRKSFAVAQSPTTNQGETWTKQLYWGVENFDVYVGDWAINPVRTKKGVSFAKPIFDDSIILIEKEVKPPDTENSLWGWLKFLMWRLLLLTIAGSGAYQQYLEAQELKQQGKDWKQEKVNMFQYYKNQVGDQFSWTKENVQETIMEIVEYQATTPVGRVFAASVVVWILVVTATNTANAAQVVIGKKKPTTIKTIPQAIKAKYPLCTVHSTNADVYIRKKYPKVVRVVKETEEDSFAALLDGECKLVVTVMDAWKRNRYNRAINPLGNLKQVGKVVKKFDAGFAVKDDSNVFCTSLVQSTLDLHLGDMVRDGVLEELWEKHLPEPITWDICDANNTSCGTTTTVGDVHLLTPEPNNLQDTAQYTTEPTEEELERSEAAAEAYRNMPWWKKALWFLISPLSWWAVFKWCVGTFWSCVFRIFMFIMVISTAGIFSYAIMIGQVMADNYMSKVGNRDDSSLGGTTKGGIQERGRDRTPRPVANNPYKPGIGRNGNVVI